MAAERQARGLPTNIADNVHYVKSRRRKAGRREALATTLQATAQAITQALFPSINRTLTA